MENQTTQIDQGYETPTDSSTERRTKSCPPPPKKAKTTTIIPVEPIETMTVPNTEIVEQTNIRRVRRTPSPVINFTTDSLGQLFI